MIFKSRTITITVICLLTLGILDCKKKDESEDESLAVLLIAASALTQRGAFSFSCNLAAGGICRNNYGNTGNTQASCVSASGTVSTSKCTAASSVGACSQGSSAVVETVYYTGTFNASSAATNCSGLGGTYASTYTQ